MVKHFWEGQPDPDADLYETQTYLRPLEPQDFANEVFESVLPIGKSSDLTESPKEEPDSLLKEHELNPQDFAQRALEHPEMWDRLDQQYLQDVLEGAHANEDLERLADDWLSGRADERAFAAGGPPEEVRRPTFDIEEDLSELEEPTPEDLEEQEAIPIPDLPPAFDDEPVDLSKVEEWWRK